MFISPAIITREEAKTAGLKRYFTGGPCLHGHIQERLVVNCLCVGCRKDASTKWRLTHPKENKASHNAWNAAHPEQLNFNTTAWRAANPEANRSIQHTRRARKRGVPGSHTARETTALLEAQGFTCASSDCNADLREVPKHLDHIIPLSRPELNPTNSIENLQWLCSHCNSSKGNKTMEEWEGQKEHGANSAIYTGPL